MSYVYLFRHGQAGTRGNYDSLSDVGRRQSELLGDYLVAQGIAFRAAYVGTMSRQQRTASAVAAAYERAAIPFPRIETVPAWNEFDLEHVFAEMAPLLARSDSDFRREYEEMLAELRAGAGVADTGIHRRWTRCDVRVVDAWIRSIQPYSGESWIAFRERVSSPRLALNGDEGNIAVFTSGTPVAIWTGLALDIHDVRVMQLAGVLLNTSITVLRLREEQLRLSSFNGVPHLADPALRTHR